MRNSILRCDIIIPVWNQLDYTSSCLNSIFRSTRILFRIIIIDNASDKQTAQYLDSIKKKYPEQIVLIRNRENLGWIKAVNQGIFYSDSRYE